MKFDLEEAHGLLLPRNETGACRNIKKTARLAWNPKFNNLKVWGELKPGSVVFDVGAFVGDTAKVFLNRKCEVHAFEPIPEVYVCLLHNCPEAHCYNLALGDGTRFSISTTHEGNLGGASLRPGDRYSIRLDDLRPQRLDFLKIDVEGYELKVIRGAMETIKRLHPVILIELNVNGLAKFGATPKLVQETLDDLGYEDQVIVNHCKKSHNEHWDILCRFNHESP